MPPHPGLPRLTCPVPPGANDPFALCSAHTTPPSSWSPQSSFLPRDPCTLSPYCQRWSSLLCPADLSALSLSCASSKSSFLAIQCGRKKETRPSLNLSLYIYHPNPTLSREFHEVMKRGTRCCFFTITPVPRAVPPP